MDQQSWAECADPVKMLEVLGDSLTERRRRLFSIACARRFVSLLTDASRAGLIIAEEFADGRATPGDLLAALRAMGDAPRSARGFAKQAARFAVAPRPGTVWDFAKHGSLSALDARRWLCRKAENRGASAAKEAARQADLLRCIVGDIFRPIALDPQWRTQAMAALAEAAYNVRDDANGYLSPARLAVLSDACEEAGCCQEMLSHIRHPGPHVRGCWVVDFCLEKV